MQYNRLIEKPMSAQLQSVVWMIIDAIDSGATSKLWISKVLYQLLLAL
jgi:hypothetical protein